MANPEPETEHLRPHQYAAIGEQPMGRVIGTRYPIQIERLLNSMPDKQGFIRCAVTAALRASGDLVE